MSVESGELRINVVADTSGFAADLKAKLARVKQSVKVDAKLNTTQLRAELARASKGVTVTVTPKVNAQALRAALAAATKGVTVDVTPKVKVAALRAALSAATRDVNVNARVDFDRAQVRASFAAATAGLRVNADVDIDKNKLFNDVRRSIILAMSNLPPIPIPTPPTPTPTPGGGGGGGPSNSASSLLRVMQQIGKYTTIAVGALALFEGAGAAILGVAGALTSVVTGLFAVASASGAAVGALAAIPAGLSLLVSVAATAIAGFKGVGEAVKGLQDSQDGAAKSAQSTARAQRSAAQTVAAAQKRLQSAYEGVESSARGVVSAQRSIRDALEGVEDAQRSSRNAAERLVDVQKSLAAAQKNVASVSVASARSIEAGEQRVVSAVESRSKAQQRLTDALKDTQRQMEDYDSRLKGAALNEEGAILAFERARERLNEVNTDPSAKILDRKEADLAYREALQSLQDLQTENGRLAKEAADAAKKGVSGADAVVDAQDALADSVKAVNDAQSDQADTVAQAAQDQVDAADAVVDAQRDVRDAYEGVESASDGLRDAYERVADAQYGLVTAQRDQVKAAQEVVDAQQGIRDAQRDAAEAIRDAAGALNESQKAFLNASPAAQDFAKFLVREFIPVLKRVQAAVQNALLPDLEVALRNLIPLEGPVTGALQAMAGAMGDLAIKASEMFASDLWRDDIIEGGENNARTFERLGDSVLDLLDTFRNITGAAQPMIDRFTEYLNLVTGGWKETAQLNRENGTLEDYFKRTGDVIAQWGRILDNVFTGVGNIADAAAPAGQALMDSFEGATENFVTWTEDNAAGIGDYFTAIVPVFESVGRILLDIVGAFARISSNPATLRITELIENRLGPALGRLIDALLDSGSGEIFVELISDILDILTDLVNSDGLEKVLAFIEGMADKIKEFTGSDKGQDVLGWLIPLAAIGGPLLLVASGAGKLLNALSKITKLPSTGTLLGKIPGLVKGAASALGKGGLIGIGGALAGNAVGGLVSDGEGGARDVAGGAISGAATGAGIGATLGSIVPGLGTGVGAAVGAGVGGIAGAINGNGGIAKTFEDIKGALRSGFDSLDDFFKERGVNLQNLLTNPFREVPRLLLALVKEIPGLLVKGFQFAGGLFDWIGDAAGTAAQKAVEFIGNIPILAVRLLTAAVRAAPKVFDFLLTQLGNVITAIGDTISAFVRDPAGTIKGIGGFLAKIGTIMFQGIDGLKDSFFGIGEKIIQGILDGLGNAGEKLAPYLAELGQAFLESTAEIRNSWNEFWEGLKDYAAKIFDIVAKAVVGWLYGVYVSIIVKIAEIKSAWNNFWQGLFDFIVGKIAEMVSAVVNFGLEVYRKFDEKFSAIKKFWTDLWDYIKNWAIQKTLEFIRDVLERYNNFKTEVLRVFGELGKSWETFWNGLKDLAAKPINFVIDYIINGGIGTVWRKVDELLGGILPDWKDVPNVKFASGGVMPGYTPGRDVHNFTSPTGGRLALSGGEAIMRPEWTRAVGGERGVAAMNRAARTGGAAAVQSMLGGQAFADGGVFQRFANGGVAAVISFGKWLRTQGYDVGENKALGDNPRRGEHSSTGYHYRDDNSGAIDVNKGAGTSVKEQIELAKAVNSARTRGLRSYFFASDGSHRDHAHFDYGKGDNVQTSKMPKEVREALTSSPSGVGGFISGLWDDVKGGAADAASALVKFAGNLPIVSDITDMAKDLLTPGTDVTLKTLATGAASSLVTGAKNFLADKVGAFFGSGESGEAGVFSQTSYGAGTGSANVAEYRGSSGVEQWRSIALKALQITGSPSSWIGSLLRRMNQESSGNPRAINLTDSNARKGTPSKGLMQTIDGTFRAYALPPYNKDVYDPLSNIIASIRYANARYGNAPKGWDKKGGYALGGVLDIPSLAKGGTVLPKTGGTLALLAEAGRAESVVDTEKLDRLFEKAINGSQGRGVVFEQGSIQVFNPAPEPASTSISDRLRVASAFGIFDQS